MPSRCFRNHIRLLRERAILMSDSVKVACVTVSFNDGYKLGEWAKWFSEYKAALSHHIIVDNGSTNDFLASLKQVFANSTILEMGHNVGSTGAYNTGIKYAIEHANADYIMLLGNDIRISSESVGALVEFMEHNCNVGMAAPIMLNADSDIVADYGCAIRGSLLLRPYKQGERLSDVDSDVHFCEAVTGGANIARASFYKQVGLQDELLFMYSDEVDMGIRAAAEGYKLAAIRGAVCWHQHINPRNQTRRNPFSDYLISRNKVYLAKKHNLRSSYPKIVGIFVAKSGKLLIKGVVKRDKAQVDAAKYTFAGLIRGLRGDMDANQYSC